MASSVLRIENKNNKKKSALLTSTQKKPLVLISAVCRGNSSLCPLMCINAACVLCVCERVRVADVLFECEHVCIPRTCVRACASESGFGQSVVNLWGVFSCV